MLEVTGSASKEIMARESAEFRRLEERCNALRYWLKRESPDCFEEQKHLEEGNPERVHWHYGYMVALRDVLRLFTEETSSNTRSADKPELSS